MGDVEKCERYTWRISRPFDRDVVCLSMFKYQWETHTPEGSDTPLVTDRQSFVLVLTPEPHWHEYQDFDILPNPTVEINGLEIVHLMGPTGMRNIQEFDLRTALEDRLGELVKVAVSAVMDLMPAVEFTDG